MFFNWSITVSTIARLRSISRSLNAIKVKVGEFDRGGKTRVPTAAADHDFDAVMSLTPYGIFLPQYNELSLFVVCSKLTADCIVELLEIWWKTVKLRFSAIQTLVINQDNGPENHSRRTQFMSSGLFFSWKSMRELIK